MSTKVIVHSIFFQCKEFTLDPYWKEIFAHCACNRFPKGVKYDGKKNTLYVKHPGGLNSKKEFFSLPKEPTEAFPTMMNVFRSLGLRSERDLQTKRDEMEEIRKDRSVDLDCSWKELKPRSLKDRMITGYVIQQQEKYNLSQREAKRLLNIIQLGFLLKQLSSDDVEYENGRILNIKGLEIDGINKTFDIAKPVKRSYKNDKSSTTNHFLQIFENYLKEAKKQRLRM